MHPLFSSSSSSLCVSIVIVIALFLTAIPISLCSLHHDDETASAPKYVPCSLSTVGAKSSGSYATANAPGTDISDNAYFFPDPFAFYTNPKYPGVTLPGDRDCSSLGSSFLWNVSINTCVFNSGGYPFPYTSGADPDGSSPELTPPQCAMDLYENGDEQAFQNTFLQWRNEALKNSTRDEQSKARLVKVRDPTNGKTVTAAIGIGHGVLSGLCGSCFLFSYLGRYAVSLQVDVRAWSLEMSSEAAQYVNPGDYGGLCRVPKVVKIDCSSVNTATP